MVSNKALAIFIIIAVVVSLGGTLLSLNKINEVQQLGRFPLPVRQITGLAAGNVSLTITTNMSCDVDSNISFGAAGKPGSTIYLDTDTDETPSGFNDCSDAAGTKACKGLEINNTGNVNINVSFKSDKAGSTLLAGQTGAGAEDFRYLLRNGTYDAGQLGCKNETATVLSWGNVPTSNVEICKNLTFLDSADMMTLEFNLTIEPDIPAGTKTALLTLECQEN